MAEKDTSYCDRDYEFKLATELSPFDGTAILLVNLIRVLIETAKEYIESLPSDCLMECDIDWRDEGQIMAWFAHYKCAEFNRLFLKKLHKSFTDDDLIWATYFPPAEMEKHNGTN